MNWTNLLRYRSNIDDVGVRLRLQILQRWLAVMGQSVAVILAGAVLDFDLPFLEMGFTIAISAVLNLWLSVQYPRSHILSDAEALVFFAYDLIQLGILLFLTGGLANPFALLILAPISLAATVMRGRATIALVILAIAIASLLRYFYVPIIWTGLALPPLYLWGIWISLVLGLVLVPGFIWRVSFERRQMSHALAATEKVLEREVRLSALDGLAAAAAHQLGTPLGTITLIAKELTNNTDLSPELLEDLDILYQQSQRCRTILENLTNEATQSDVLISRLSLREMLLEAIEEAHDYGREIELICRSSTDDDENGELAGNVVGSEPILSRRPEIIYGLGNLIENAAEFAINKVVVEARYSKSQISVSVTDDGAGIPSDVMARLGEPFNSSRGPTSQVNASGQAVQSAQSGMGLGFFIAKTLLERSGARLDVHNMLSSQDDRARKYLGARIILRWSRSAIEASDDQ